MKLRIHFSGHRTRPGDCGDNLARPASRALLSRVPSFDGTGMGEIVRLYATHAPVRQKPAIVSITPESAAVHAGDPVTLTVNAAGTGPLTFQWSDPVPAADKGKATVTAPPALSGTCNFGVT